MNKIMFLGESDENFTHHNLYNLINIQLIGNLIYAWLSNDNNKISCMPYDSLNSFNENWYIKN